VAALFAAGGYFIVKSRGGAIGSNETSSNGLAIESVQATGDGNAQKVTWSDTNDSGAHYLYAVGANFANLVAADQSPTTVVLPTKGGACFVLANKALTTKSAPTCINGASKDIVPPDLK
jgi:hypothetical protein